MRVKYISRFFVGNKITGVKREREKGNCMSTVYVYASVLKAEDLESPLVFEKVSLAFFPSPSCGPANYLLLADFPQRPSLLARVTTAKAYSFNVDIISES